MSQAELIKIAVIIVAIILISYFLKINCLVHKVMPKKWQRKCSSKEGMIDHIGANHPFGGGGGRRGCVCPQVVMGSRGHHINPFTYV